MISLCVTTPTRSSTFALLFIFINLFTGQAHAGPDAADRRVFQFPTGVSVVSPKDGEGGVYIKKGVHTEWITKEAVLTFPVNEASQESPWSWSYDDDVAAVLIEGKKDVWAVTPNGKVIHLPLDPTKAETTDIQGRVGLTVGFSTFDHDGRSYELISGDYERSKCVGNFDGETFLVRDDGAWLRVAFTQISTNETPEKFHVTDDGILVFDELPRQIDLQRFDVEANLPISPPIIVKDNDGNVIEDPAARAFQEFPDLLTRVRTGSLKTFGFLPGEDETVNSIRMALAQEESGSFALLGEAGTGKSQLVYSFLEQVAHGAYPEIPRSIRVLTLDRSSLEQGTTYTGQFESKVSLLKYLSHYGPLYLFADEMHSLRGAGTHEGSNVDFFEMIKTELADGSIRILGTSTEEEFYRAFSGNTAILRRVQVVKKLPSDEEKTIKALQGWLARFRKPTIPDEVLSAAYRLSTEFSAVGAQPAKATKLLDSAFASLKIESRPDDSLNAEDIQKAAQRLYNLPPSRFDPMDALERQANLRHELDGQVIGQSEYKGALARANGLRLAGLQDPRRPVRVLVAGSTGVGKTATAEAFAQAIGATYYRVEMSKYAAGGVDALRREIAGALRKDPFSVVCLDEFEKADISVQLAILSALDDGYFNVLESLDSSSSSMSMTSVRVNTTKASFIATTNAASDWLARTRLKAPLGFLASDSSAQGSPEEGGADAVRFQTELRAQLINDGIPDTIVGRFSVVTAALPPTEVEFQQVLGLHTGKLLASIARRGGSRFAMTNPDAFFAAMARSYFTARPPTQNRIVFTLLEEYLQPAILEATLDEMRRGTKGLGFYDLTWIDGKFLVQPAASVACEEALVSRKK